LCGELAELRSPIPVHPQVKKLLELQKLDQQIASLRRDLDALPAETAKRSKALDAKRQDAANKEKAVQENELAVRNLELSTKQADEEIKKLDGRLNTVKNNAEYQATLLQIESSKRERDRVQEEALALLDKLAPLKAAFTEARDAAAAEGKVFEKFQDEARKLVAAREAEVAAVAAGRTGLVAGIPRDLLDRYDKLFKSRDRLSVCAVEGQVCQGCYNRITMNDIARLRGGASIVECGSCNRILYLRDESA
jgi:predicted  nucleic acid-binding Zn-ribbon protein